jgi:multiple sugar transport system substrate-binding protein
MGRPGHRQHRPAACLASLAVAALLLGACSSGAGTSGAGGTTNITVLLSKETAPAGAENSYFKQIAAQFHAEHPNAKVTFDFWATPTQETTAIQTAAISSTGPDIMGIGSSIVPTAQATGAFRVLTAADWQQLGGRSSFLASQLADSGPTASQDIGVPDRTTGFGILYNKSMFAQAGITTPPKTWSEFIADAQKLTDPAKGVWGATLDPADPKDPWHMLWLLSVQDGSELLSTQSKTGLLTSPVVENQAAFWLDWMTKYHIASPKDATNQFSDSLTQFIDGQAAMFMPVGTSAIPRLAASAEAHNYGIVPMPTIPYGLSALPRGGVPAESFTSSEYYAITKYSADPSLDLDLIKLIVSPKYQDLVAKNEGYLPSTNAAITADPALAKAPYPALEQIVKDEFPTPWTGSWGTVETSVGSAITSVASSVATSGTFTQSQLDSALAQANQEITQGLQAAK